MTRLVLVFVSCDVDGDGVIISLLSELLVLTVWVVKDELSVKSLTNCWILRRKWKWMAS